MDVEITEHSAEARRRSAALLAGNPFPERGAVDDLLWRCREAAQEQGHEYGALADPRTDADAILDAWFAGDARLYLQVRIAPALPGADECDLFVDLQRSVSARPPETRNL